ncbi:MAG TPA: C25 family cysteine peptidase [Acidobacteriota bacterium]|nr:C25 family cysteine peptidase [Acidobacteriota bacterium]
MSEEKEWRKRLTRAENQALEPGVPIRGEIRGNMTHINIRSLANEYKLGKAYEQVRNLEFRADKEVELEVFPQYVKAHRAPRERRFTARTVRRPGYTADEGYRNRRSRLHYPKGRMLVLVDKAVYNDVAGSIAQYVLDVGRDGYWATIHVVDGGKPAHYRNYIKSKNPVGVFLVGAIPAPWYEIGSDQFPCDLYYMDLNGTWNDPDSDGKFEGHIGNLDPEIWVGRLYTPTKNGNDAKLITDYFKRNHKFRLGHLGHSISAMAYVDDDWQGFGDCALDLTYPASQITTYTTPTQTDADLYKSEVNSLRSFVQLCAHSHVHAHALRVGTTNEYINYLFFKDTNPPNAHFYNLFCCGPGRFTTQDYLAGWYIFDKAGGGTNLGLTAIASAKSGSMLMFEDFYRPLGRGKTIGESFVDWWRARGPSHEAWERYWFYGLALLGDPTMTWWKGLVPTLEQPQENDVFDFYPRKMEFRWDPVNISGVKYTLEIDAFHAVNAGKWAEETGQSFFVKHNLTGNTFDHYFVGAQRGRWRVRANVGGKLCSWSPWSYFRFTI